MKCSMCKENRETLMVKLTDACGETIYCPNCLAVAYLNRTLHLENHPDFVDDVTGCNGAVKYEATDETYVLEVETMKRLIAHNLDPDEYYALANKYGADKFMIHSDFYDDFDGVAIQPMY